MTDDQFQDYLRERYHDQINWFSAKARKYKTWFQIMMTATIILSTSAPVVTALASEKWIQLIVTGSVAVLTSFQQTLRLKELWTSYRGTAEALKREHYFYQASLHPYRDTTDEQKRSVFIYRVEELLGKENEHWDVAQKSQDEECDSGGEVGTGS